MLDQLEREPADANLINVILIVGVDSGQHHVGAESIHRQRYFETRIEISKRCLGQDQQRVSVRKCRVRARFARIGLVAIPPDR
jgi:hypothetical protein